MSVHGISPLPQGLGGRLRAWSRAARRERHDEGVEVQDVDRTVAVDVGPGIAECEQPEKDEEIRDIHLPVLVQICGARLTKHNGDARGKGQTCDERLQIRAIKARPENSTGRSISLVQYLVVVVSKDAERGASTRDDVYLLVGPIEVSRSDADPRVRPEQPLTVERDSLRLAEAGIRDNRLNI